MGDETGPGRAEAVSAVARIIESWVGDGVDDEADLPGRLRRQNADGWRVDLDGRPTSVRLSDAELRTALAMVRADIDWDGAP